MTVIVGAELSSGKGDVGLKITIGEQYFEQVQDAFNAAFPGRVIAEREVLYDKATWVQVQLAEYIRRVIAEQEVLP